MLIFPINRKIVEEVCLSHYACNFFLYLLTGEQFRKSFSELITCQMESSKKWRCNANGSFYAEVPMSQRNSWAHTGSTRL